LIAANATLTRSKSEGFLLLGGESRLVALIVVSQPHE
jgi:hypothetical protein